MSTEDGQDAIIAILGYEIDKRFAHLAHELFLGNLQQLGSIQKK